jgi:hypothetical protein
MAASVPDDADKMLAFIKEASPGDDPVDLQKAAAKLGFCKPSDFVSDKYAAWMRDTSTDDKCAAGLKVGPARRLLRYASYYEHGPGYRTTDVDKCPQCAHPWEHSRNCRICLHFGRTTRLPPDCVCCGWTKDCRTCQKYVESDVHAAGGEDAYTDLHV